MSLGNESQSKIICTVKEEISLTAICTHLELDIMRKLEEVNAGVDCYLKDIAHQKEGEERPFNSYQ